MRAVAVIPARFASTRFPGKPLAPILGRPMVAWVVEAALGARLVDEVVVATDHDGIRRAARRAGARALMTSPRCATGTDRVAEVARSVAADVFVNLQGDEPLLDPRDVDGLVEVFRAEPSTRMATLSRPLARPEDLARPDVVKVVCDATGHALYFSRSPIPFYRDAWGAGGPAEPPADQVPPAQHVGIYGFSQEAVRAFPGLPAGRLEAAEGLEQLRALEAGWRIRVVPALGAPVGVDRPEDVPRIEEILRRRGAG